MTEPLIYSQALRPSPPVEPAGPPPLIGLAKLTKRYGPIVAIDKLDARIDGKIIGLLGPNGAGKSTLLKALLGLIPYEGGARVLGLEARTHGADIRDRVGYMPEQEAFLSGLSAVEMCTYAAELSGLPHTEAKQRAHAALYYAGLEEKRYQPIDGYSTGMKQRVKLAQALVHDPEILFLDEPTNGLDPRSRDEMLDLIGELPEKRGCTIMISTHLLTDVDRVCDTAIIMHQGQIRFADTTETLRASAVAARDYIVEVREGVTTLYDALTAGGAQARAFSPVALTVTLPESMSPRNVLELARAAGVQIRILEPHRESMEQAFLRVVSGPAPIAVAGPGGTP